MTAVGIIGASGYTGAELLRICAQHPELDVVFATGDSQAGAPIASLNPSLARVYGERTFDHYTPEALDGLDLVFLGLPHGASQALMAEVRGESGTRRTSPQQDASERLTAREREVLAALARGLTYDQVGMVLDVSGNTVRTHIRKLYQKLGAASRTEAVLAAMERGVLRPSSGIGPDSGRPPAF